MNRWGAAAILVAGAAALASGAAGLSVDVQNTLTTIDSVPTKPQLDNVFPAGEALSSLSTIAMDTGADVGIRLRAIHALGKYCPARPELECTTTELAYTSLTDLILETRNFTHGSEVLLLRSAIETIGVLEVSATASDQVAELLKGLLNHPSRDIRAATARALRDLCNTQVITPLRVRYTSESTEQVKLAISEALRVLGQCTTTP